MRGEVDIVMTYISLIISLLPFISLVLCCCASAIHSSQYVYHVVPLLHGRTEL